MPGLVLANYLTDTLAAAWAVTQALGVDGYVDLTRRLVAATATIREAIDDIDGLRVQGEPTGPLVAVVADGADPVHPHLWATAVASEHVGSTSAPKAFLDRAEDLRTVTCELWFPIERD